MKAAIYNGLKNINVVNIEKPVCGDNDVLLKNLYASVCGSDISVYFHGEYGHRILIGHEFGHEMVSEAVEVSKNVKGIKVGDRLYPYPRFAKGDPGLAGSVGGFSEYVLVPNCELDKQVYLVDDKIPDKAACLIEPFTVGTRAARRSNPQIDEKAIVFGAGAIGISAAIALKYFGCSQVMIVDFSEFRLAKAKKMGFEVCNSNKEDLKLKAFQVFGESKNFAGPAVDVDIFIDATGAASVLESMFSLGKFFSKMVLVGVHHAPRTLDFLSFTYSQQSLTGSGGYAAEDVKDVMKIMESGKYDISSIITHEYVLDDIEKAIQKASESDNALKVAIKY